MGSWRHCNVLSAPSWPSDASCLISILMVLPAGWSTDLDCSSKCSLALADWDKTVARSWNKNKKTDVHAGQRGWANNRCRHTVRLYYFYYLLQLSILYIMDQSISCPRRHLISFWPPIVQHTVFFISNVYSPRAPPKMWPASCLQTDVPSLYSLSVQDTVFPNCICNWLICVHLKWPLCIPCC